MLTQLHGRDSEPLDPSIEDAGLVDDLDSERPLLDARRSRARGVLGALDCWLAEHVGDTARWRIAAVLLGVTAGVPVGWLLTKYSL